MNSAPSSDAAAGRPPLRRDGQRRMLLGVCAGIARTLDADPVLVRAVVIVIGLLAGPLAVIAYVATAVITPRDDGRMLLAGDPPDSRENWLGWIGVLVAAGMLVASGPVFDGFWDGDPVATPLLAIALIAGVIVLIRANRDRHTGLTAATTTTADAPVAPEAPATATAATAVVPADQAPTAGGWGRSPAVRTYAPRAGGAPMHSPPAPAPPKPAGPSIFLPVAGVITAGAAVATVIDAVGLADLSAAAVAVLLAAGALVGGVTAAVASGRRGRVATLILAVVLALGAATTAALDEQLDDGVGYREIRPAIAADLQPEYRLGVGLLELDLRDTKLPDGVTNVKADVGMGEIQLRVAPDVRVVPVGDTSIDGRLEPDVPTKDGQPPVLRLDADVGVGGPVDLIR